MNGQTLEQVALRGSIYGETTGGGPGDPPVLWFGQRVWTGDCLEARDCEIYCHLPLSLSSEMLLDQGRCLG